MDTFKEREKGYENKYAHDLEVAYLARVRAHYQAGLWAAAMLGKTGEDAEAYAQDIRMEDIRGHGPRAVAERLEAELGNRARPGEVDAKIRDLRQSAERALKGEWS